MQPQSSLSSFRNEVEINGSNSLIMEIVLHFEKCNALRVFSFLSSFQSSDLLRVRDKVIIIIYPGPISRMSWFFFRFHKVERLRRQVFKITLLVTFLPVTYLKEGCTVFHHFPSLILTRINNPLSINAKKKKKQTNKQKTGGWWEGVHSHIKFSKM